MTTTAPIADDVEPGASRFELRISVSGATGEHDVIVDASAGDRVQDLADALTAYLGVSEHRNLWCQRRRLNLDPSARVEQVGVRWGDHLLLVPSPPEPTRVGGIPLIEVAITAGPCAGQRWTLGQGVYRVGRSPDCDVHLVDPSLSREHVRIEVDKDTVALTDLGSSNGTALDGRALQPRVSVRVRPQDEIEMGRTLIRIRSLDPRPGEEVAEIRGRVQLNRPPRVRPTMTPFEKEIPAPPARARKARLPLAASVVPLVMGGVMFLVLGSAFMLVICALSPLMAVGTYLTERRGGNKSFSRGSSDFRKRVDRAVGELDTALVEEIATRRSEAPDMATLIERVRNVDPGLWERRPSNSDFMYLRVGVGDVPARSSVTLADGGDDELREEAEEKLASRRTVPSVPVVVDLPRVGMLGLAGPRRFTEALARTLLLQVALLHSPGELMIVAGVGERSLEDWSWLRWLPHTGAGQHALTTSLACGRSETEALLTEIRDLAADRRAQLRHRDGLSARRITVLAMLDEDTGVDRSLVSAALTDAAEVGILAIWTGRSARDVPGQAGAIVEAREERAQAVVTDVASARVLDDVSLDGVELDTAEETARLLAPIQDVGELASAGDIPADVSLLELLDLSPVTSSALEQRWRAWRGRVAATIGMGVDGPFGVDLAADGPHALIAGTTGSGKSELLRTFVASAAAAAPPDRLIFLLVDYKGGAAFAPCAGLPHVVDIVSDLDEHLAERALVSLQAELKRRERVLAERGVKDLAELQRRAPEVAPPMLVIAVDEFAKLREEVPEFVDGVVDIAQRGRSLGVHMVLAAQTLRNAFTPAIRANTNLRVALRVAEDSESDDVIASPVAARIPSGELYRGRAYARTGHSELREFQAAYVSGRTPSPEKRELTVRPFTVPRQAAAGAADAFDSDEDNDLTALAVAATSARAALGLRPVPSPWLPALPDVLPVDDVPVVVLGPGRAVIGLVDLPHLQRQDPLVVDLPSAGNVAVFGAGGSGKTTALTTTALALARTHPPEELRMYGLDAGSGALAQIGSLPHCGAVIAADDVERVDRLFRELLRRIDSHSDAAARGTPDGESARIVVFLDDIGSFINVHDKPGPGSAFEQLQRVLAGGRPAGIHVMFTASRRGAVSAAISAHVGQRLVLRMPTTEEMLSLGLDGKLTKGVRLPPGRGFTHDSLEFQIGLPVDADGASAFEAIAGQIRSRSRDVTRLVTLPTEVNWDALEPAQSAERVPIGIADSDLGPATVDLLDSHFLVIGSYRSGRSTALRALALGLARLAPATELWLFAPRRSPLRDLDVWSHRATTPEECADAIQRLSERLRGGASDSSRVFLFVDDGGELSDPLLSTRLEAIVRAGRDGGLTVIVAAETGAARGITISWIREVRREGRGLLLQPDLLADGDLLGTPLPRRVAVPMVVGRGFLVDRGRAELIQVAS